MAVFIFGENKLEHPFFVEFSIGYKKVNIGQSTGVTKDGKSHNVVILKTLENARDKLKEGVRVTTPDGGELLVKIKRVFKIFEKIEVFYNGEEIKGHEFVKVTFS